MNFSDEEFLENIVSFSSEINIIFYKMTSFAAISEEQAAKTEELSYDSKKLSQFSTELNNFAKKL